MVILIATRNGYEELKPVIFSGLYPVWLGAEVLSQEEIDSIRVLGIDLTDFNYTINIQNFSEIEGAVETIREHHPNQKVWLSGHQKFNKSLKHRALRALDSFKVAVLWFCCAKVFHKTTT